MDISKKLLTISLSLLMIVSSFSYVYGEENYKVVDIVNKHYEEIDYFEDLDEAYRFYNQHLEDYDNLTIIEGDKVLDTEYGVIEFINKDGSDIEYASISNGTQYINGQYSSEACYLYKEEGLVYFKLAGDIGYINGDEVKIIPYGLLTNEVSVYITDDEYLRHLIKTNLSYNYYNYDLKLDKIPYGLDTNKHYYSYDNHFFYEDFKVMVDDYKNNTFDNSINAEAAYYNYYEYLPHRSYTKYSYEEIENYFTNELCLEGKLYTYKDLNKDNANDEVNLSQMVNELDSFFGYEAIYGANAMMLISSAINESAYGKSLNSFKNNNLYSEAAFDSEEERNNERFNNVSNSIYSHAKYYVSKLAGGVYSDNYNGTFFGDLNSGMNPSYSSDPYWGEKNSSVYFNLDEKLGFKDSNNYALGIIKNQKVIRIYRNEQLKDLYYEFRNVDDFSLILLEELDDAYKIQVEYSGGDPYKYNPQVSIGYIAKEEITYIINKEEINDIEYKEAYFDFNEGTLHNEYSLTVVVPSDKQVKMVTPIKDGYEFIKYSDVGIAEYLKINEIKVTKDFKKIYGVNDNLDLEDGVLLVSYEDGSSKSIDINSNMIHGFDSSQEGEVVLTIEYCGIEIEYPINITNELNTLYENLKNILVTNINSYQENGSYNLEELEYLKNNLANVNYPLDMNEIRYLDMMLLENTRDILNYNYKENNRDLSISGLALSLNNPKELSIFKPFKDTYYIEVKDKDIKDTRLESIAKAYDFELVDSFNISLDYNLQKANFKNPFVVSVKVNDKDPSKIYTVYHIDENNNIIKCVSEHSSNYVSFMSESEGDFIILSKDSVNNFEFDDYYENISIDNSDPDNHLLFIEGGIIMIVSILGFIMIVIYYILNKKEEKIWNDYKKYLLEAESVRVVKRKN